jgi:hypothetical protein
MKMIIRNLSRKMDHVIERSGLIPEDKFFCSIYGNDIKKLLLRCIVAKETKKTTHVLLTGPTESSKTLFLLEMLKGLENVLSSNNFARIY